MLMLVYVCEYCCFVLYVILCEDDCYGSGGCVYC